MRQGIRRSVPKLRSLFLMRITSFKYRLGLRCYELPEIVRAAQQAYDERSAAVLEELADWLEGKSPPGRETPATGIEAVDEARESSIAEGEEQERLDALINLYRHIDKVIASLVEQIAAADASGVEVG